MSRHTTAPSALRLRKRRAINVPGRDAIFEEAARTIAGRVHDALGQTAAALRLEIDLLEGARGTTSRQAARLSRIRSLCDELCRGIRGIALELDPPMLAEAGLAAAIRWQARHRLAPAGIRVVDQLDESADPPPSPTVTGLFRVVQEAITNIIRHAGATQVRLALQRRGARLRIEVADDGAGFDVAGAGRSTSAYGLPGMRARVRALGGRLQIRRGPGGGMRVLVSVSLRNLRGVGMGK